MYSQLIRKGIQTHNILLSIAYTLEIAHLKEKSIC